MNNQIRLQVFLSRNGVTSRRKAFDLIREGHVKVNGRMIREPSMSVDPARDKIEVDGQLIQPKNYDYILLNKPRGVTTTREDIFAEKTVMELLPAEFRHLVPVGRLDKDTEGLILLTNDGDLVYSLTHPKFNIDKTYLVCVTGKLKSEDKIKLEQGIVLEDRKTAPAKIEDIKQLSNQTEFLITIHEGRKRQIRMMLGALKYPVVYLKRITQGPLSLGDLAVGEWRHLTAEEINRLKDLKISIPMKGNVDSLNVSASTAVVLYEALRQRSS